MQSIQTPVLAVLTADTAIPRLKVRASWLKISDPTVNWALVGSSLVGGIDLVQGQSSIITNADFFDYMDESEHVMLLEYDRRIDEPRGGISYAIANVLLDNITKRFSPDYNSTIGTAIEARRPFKMSVGFDVNGVDRLVQVCVGLTANKPKMARTERTVRVDVYDYITFINNSQINSAIYEDVWGHEIIEDILVNLGFGSSQYKIDSSLNFIPFAWFDKNKSAGQRIKEVCEAEEATFYQDENGILRFENRNKVASPPYTTPVRNIDPSDIITDEEDNSTRIINRAIVTALPRRVDDTDTDIWSYGTVEAIPPGQTIDIWAAFFDETGSNVLPVRSIVTPAAGTDYAGNTAPDGSGSDRTADLDVQVTNFVETAKIEITNNHGSDTVYLTLDVANNIAFKLRGRAARVIQAIQVVREDAQSINKYEAQEYPVTNNLIQTSEMARTMADNLVAKYKNPMARRKIRIPGIPHLQLKDLVSIVNADAENLIKNDSFEVNLNQWQKTEIGTASATFERTMEIPILDGYFAAKLQITT